MLPFNENDGLQIEAFLTDDGTDYKGQPTIHLYEFYPEPNDIEHRTIKVAGPRTYGFVERYNRTVPDAIFRMAIREKLYESVDALHKDLHAWLR